MANKLAQFTAHFIGGPRDGATEPLEKKTNFLYAGRVEDGCFDTWAKGRARYDLTKIRSNDLYFTFLDYKDS